MGAAKQLSEFNSHWLILFFEVFMYAELENSYQVFSRYINWHYIRHVREFIWKRHLKLANLWTGFWVWQLWLLMKFYIWPQITNLPKGLIEGSVWLNLNLFILHSCNSWVLWHVMLCAHNIQHWLSSDHGAKYISHVELLSLGGYKYNGCKIRQWTLFS